MQELTRAFSHTEFGEIRVVDVDGKPGFVAADVAKALGYKNTRDAISRHCKGVVKHDTLTKGGIQQMNVILKPDVWRLIAHSELPGAEAFEAWIFEEVLVAIDETGGYIPVKEDDDEKTILAKAFNITQKTIKRQEEQLAAKDEIIESQGQQIVDMLPKSNYFDVILQCKDAIPVTHISKDYGMSAVAFNKILASIGIQHKVGKTWVLKSPYDRNGYTVSETIHDGGTSATILMKFTQRGRYWLYGILKDAGHIPVMEQLLTAEETAWPDVDSLLGVAAVSLLTDESEHEQEAINPARKLLEGYRKAKLKNLYLEMYDKKSVDRIICAKQIAFTDGLLDILRKGAHKGEKLYWILYESYMSEPEPSNVDEILERIKNSWGYVAAFDLYRYRNKGFEFLNKLISAIPKNSTTEANCLTTDSGYSYDSAVQMLERYRVLLQSTGDEAGERLGISNDRLQARKLEMVFIESLVGRLISWSGVGKIGLNMYWTIYCTDMSLAKRDMFEVLDDIGAKYKKISVRTYWRSREKALEALNTMLKEIS